MEPDVARMYSSSPPPLDDGAEDDDEEFGDFGGFSGVPSSVSFTEFDTPSSFGEPQSAADVSPPNLCENGSASFVDAGSRPFDRGSLEDDSASSDADAPGVESHSSLDGFQPCKTMGAEDLKKLAGQAQVGLCLKSGDPEMGNGRTADDTWGCNGGSPPTEVLTNGFGTFDTQEASPSPHKKGIPMDPALECHSSSPDHEFADFSAFSNTITPVADDAREHRDDVSEGKSLGGRHLELHARAESSSEEEEGDSERRVGDTGIGGPAARGAVETLSNGERALHTEDDGEQRDMEPRTAHQGLSELDGQNDGEPAEPEEGGATESTAALSQSKEGRAQRDEGPSDVPDNGVMDHDVPDSSEDCGGSSRTNFAPSQRPCAEETRLPKEDQEEEDFGEFGGAATCSWQDFADFDHMGDDHSTVGGELDSRPQAVREGADEEDFGDFDSPKEYSHRKDGDSGEGQFADFPGSDSFADFSSAPVSADPEFDTGWNAFGGHKHGEGAGGDSWAAFGQGHSGAGIEEQGEQWQGGTVSTPPPAGPHSYCKESAASLASRLERLFQAGFPSLSVPEPGAGQEEEEVGEEAAPPLRVLLELPEPQEQGEEQSTAAARGGPWDVWRQLQDIHNAFGLRHQWGGSHSNKALLCSLGIDTRNILFTGQKKQPVIVPMYAAGLGMLEPTKEPVKPISAAEKIASIAQAPPVSQEMSVCPSDPAQEVLPPVQFDWSSSGLTNPLDGVDPELYELTTAKLDPSSSSSRVADAFARLMSTVEKTSTSTRKPRKEENLSEEAARVIASLPDLSFMHAKVLMFPTTLTPLGTSSAPLPD